eukprot:SAG31_NODE_962_length_10731_cov_4.198552_12_plen_94_part_00
MGTGLLLVLQALEAAGRVDGTVHDADARVAAAKAEVTRLQSVRKEYETAGELRQATQCAHEVQRACELLEALCPNGAGGGKVYGVAVDAELAR